MNKLHTRQTQAWLRNNVTWLLLLRKGVFKRFIELNGFDNGKLSEQHFTYLLVINSLIILEGRTYAPRSRLELYVGHAYSAGSYNTCIYTLNGLGLIGRKRRGDDVYYWITKKGRDAINSYSYVFRDKLKKLVEDVEDEHTSKGFDPGNMIIFD